MGTMKTPDQIVAEVEARRREERWARTAAQMAGAQKLETLLGILDHTTSLKHRGIVWDMSPSSDERAVVFRNAGGEVARWRRDGEVLIFSATGERTSELNDALAITTVWLLEQFER
jgi:hypothetical protein